MRLHGNPTAWYRFLATGYIYETLVVQKLVCWVSYLETLDKWIIRHGSRYGDINVETKLAYLDTDSMRYIA